MIDLPPTMRRCGIRLMERGRRTDALGLLPDLLASQWRTAADLRDEQLRLLRDHLEFCGKNVPYYADLFAERDFDPCGMQSAADLARLPVMDKKGIREAGESLFSSRFRQMQTRPKSTSGSTGIPLNYYLDRVSHSYLWAHIWRAWEQTGYRPGDPYATLSGGSLIPEKVDLKQRIYLALSGALHLPSYHLTEEIMARYAGRLARASVRYMYGYPSSLELFSSYLLATGAKGLSLQAVFTTSELLTAAARTTIQEGLQARVFDTYGCNDGGLYAFECEHHDGWHQAMESCLVEIVDDRGSPVPSGETGRIVSTHFANKAHPFLRYETGDIGALDPAPCPCGRGLVRITRLQGRERDFVVTPTGRKVHGAFFNHFEPFYASEWLDRFQIFQPDRQRIIVRMKINRPPTDAEKSAMIAELKRGLDDMDIELAVVDSFELTESGKFRVVISCEQ